MAKISKILYIITQSEWGGAQRYVFDLATNLPTDKYKTYVAAGGDEELHAKLDEHAIKSYKLKNLVRKINPIKDVLAYFELRKLIKQIKPDIVHLNSSKAGVIGAIAAKHLGVKKIFYTAHGFVFNESMSKWKKSIYIWIEKFSARYKDKLICVSEFDRQTGIKNKITSENKLITIHNGIEPINFFTKQEARTNLELPQDKIIIGTVANLYPTKGLIYLIEAAKIIVDKFSEVIFRVIGSGQLEGELKSKIINLKLENNFFIAKKQEAYKYLKAFDIFVLPSAKEGFPYTILEAAQAGLPIVATKVGGIPEAITDNINGLLVEPKSPESLAEALNELIENKNLAEKLANQALTDLINIFSLKIMIQKTEKIYSQV